MNVTIIDQMNKFFKYCFDLMFDLKKPGRTKSNTAIKKIAGMICSNPIFNYSKNF